MKASRLLRFFAGTAIVLGAFEACSGDDNVEPVGADGAPNVAITSVSLGDGAALACDYTISVVLEVDNWVLRPPNTCAVQKCGQVRVSLLDADGAAVATQVAASSGVALKLDKNIDAGSYTLKAELVQTGTDVTPIVGSDGGSTAVETEVTVLLPVSDCAAPPAGEGGAGGEGGSAGAAGASDAAGAAGLAGDGAGGAGEVPSSAGAAGA